MKKNNIPKFYWAQIYVQITKIPFNINTGHYTTLCASCFIWLNVFQDVLVGRLCALTWLYGSWWHVYRYILKYVDIWPMWHYSCILKMKFLQMNLFLAHYVHIDVSWWFHCLWTYTWVCVGGFLVKVVFLEFHEFHFIH